MKKKLSTQTKPLTKLQLQKETLKNLVGGGPTLQTPTLQEGSPTGANTDRICTSEGTIQP